MSDSRGNNTIVTSARDVPHSMDALWGPWEPGHRRSAFLIGRTHRQLNCVVLRILRTASGTVGEYVDIFDRGLTVTLATRASAML